MEQPISRSITYEEARILAARAAKVFQPRTPITTKELFAGRWNELTTIADAVNQTGLHVVIYGERGVGKTSLANVVGATIWALDRQGEDPEKVPERLVIKTVTSSGDTFSTLWHKLFKELSWSNNKASIGLLPAPRKERVSIREAFGFGDEITTDDVRRMLSLIPGAVYIIDEFDRAAQSISREFTDLIKTLSDFGVDCTVILVGVSNTVDQLISDHASINRALNQILLPRMEPEDLRKILSNAEKSLEVKFSPDAAKFIVYVSQGLPHYTHLLGLNAVRSAALERFTTYVEREDVFAALENAVKQAQQSVTTKYIKATHSAHKDALYRHVLLACGLTATRFHDALGYFNPASVVDPLGKVLKRDVEIATFNSHLNEFCGEKRGQVLERDGQARGYRYRFADPLLVPFIFMDAVATGLISDKQLSEMLEDE